MMQLFKKARLALAMGVLLTSAAWVAPTQAQTQTPGIDALNAWVNVQCFRAWTSTTLTYGGTAGANTYTNPVLSATLFKNGVGPVAAAPLDRVPPLSTSAKFSPVTGGRVFYVIARFTDAGVLLEKRCDIT